MSDSLVKVTSPTSGSVVEVMVSVGDSVTVGQVLMIIESMKMEIPVESESAGTVEEVTVESASPVDVGDVVARIRA